MCTILSVMTSGGVVEEEEEEEEEEERGRKGTVSSQGLRIQHLGTFVLRS
jgi:hypothetical protein